MPMNTTTIHSQTYAAQAEPAIRVPVRAGVVDTTGGEYAGCILAKSDFGHNAPRALLRTLPGVL